MIFYTVGVIYKTWVANMPRCASKKGGKKPKWEAFCVKCRKKVTIKNPQVVTLKNKRKAVKGKCPNCGTTVYRFIKQ
jgi:predicted RNA-binding Zn-ribbon protein involved in translation (DUF1610 family)